MKEALLTILRNKETSRAAYREATEQLASLLAMEVAAFLPQESVTIQTPIGETTGVRFEHPVVLVPVLRSGLALLYPFLRFFSQARVGFVGLRRDEVTKEPLKYYVNLPPFTQDDRVIVLEPMIATGGSGLATLDLLTEAGLAREQLLMVSIVAAPEGQARIRAHYPQLPHVIAKVDQTLNAAKFIVPGLGDFGDRYFGT